MSGWSRFRGLFIGALAGLASSCAVSTTEPVAQSSPAPSNVALRPVAVPLEPSRPAPVTAEPRDCNEDVIERTTQADMRGMELMEEFEKQAPDLEPLTLAMARDFPASLTIGAPNRDLFRSNPTYRERVLAILHESTDDPCEGARVHINMGFILLASGVASADPRQPSHNQLWIFLPKTERSAQWNVDAELTERALVQFHLSSLAPGGKIEWMEIETLLLLGRHEEALARANVAVEQANDITRPGLMMSQAMSLYAGGKRDEAVAVLKRIRRVDAEGGNGPGHTTHYAENALGLIALSEGDILRAGKHLRAACNVVVCPHTQSGFTMELARRLPNPPAVAAYLKCNRERPNFLDVLAEKYGRTRN